MDGSLVITQDGEVLPPEPDPSKQSIDKRRKFTDAQIIAALRERGALVSAAARELQTLYNKPCSPAYLRRIIKLSPRLTAVRDDIVEEMLDDAEANLLDALCNTTAGAAMTPNQRWATQFTLETLGKNRGYGRRTEITGAKGGPLEIKITGDDAKLV